MSKDKGEAKDKNKSEKKKKRIVTISVVALVLIVLGCGGFGAFKYFTRAVEEKYAVVVPEDARSFTSSFKDYLLMRTEMVRLIKYGVGNWSNEQILNKLIELKEGFSRVSRAVDVGYEESEYKDLSGVMAYDATTYLKVVRELRRVVTGNYENEADRQAKFVEVAQDWDKEIRSGFYVMRAAFEEDVEKLWEKGVLVFSGGMMVEVGEGVINIYVGDYDKGVTAVTTDDTQEKIKMVRGKGLYGLVSGRLVKIGEGLKEELELGKLTEIKVTIEEKEAWVEKTRASLVMKSTKDLDVTGLVAESEENEAAVLDKTIDLMRGKKSGES